MANAEIDPLTLKDWEDAFAQPVPAVRKLEQQLRRHAGENREKLRQLVGVSYRDLLGTAERIIDMDRQMRDVETILGSTGQRCNAKLVGRMGKNYAGMVGERKETAHERNALAAHLAVLDACTVVITRILRGKGSLLLAAKLLILSRLTHKTLLQTQDQAPTFIGTLRDKLASLRLKLLRAIDKRFADAGRDNSKLVDDMCAFALATSSTPSDVLQHYLKIRLRALTWRFEQEVEVEAHAAKGMQLLLTTLRDAQAIFPKRLGDALVRLRDFPLIKQADVVGVHELRLGMHARWLADELRNYTPWPRHDELQKPEADKMLKSWAKTAQRALLAGLNLSLARLTAFDHVLDLRQTLFETWPTTAKGLLGLHSADVVDELREVINARLTALIETDVAKLEDVCIRTRETIMNLSSAPALPSLWTQSLTDIDIGNGAEKFKSAILHSYNGIDASTSTPLLAFNNWINDVKQIQSCIKRMKDARWDDDLADDEDDMDSRQVLLSEDDPRSLDDCLRSSLLKASTALADTFTTLIGEHEGKGDSAIALLRILREISKRALIQDKLLSDVVEPLTSTSIIAPLHAAIATAIVSKTTPLLAKSLQRLQRAPRAVTVSLWEGKPALPVQPAPWTFRLLKAITGAMAELGADLWSATAVEAVKDNIANHLSNELAKTIDAIGASGEVQAEPKAEPEAAASAAADDTSDNNGAADVGVVKRAAKEKLTQLVFDVQYLSAALVKPKAPSLLQGPVASAITGAELGEAEAARLKKGGTEYWKRSYLLFGLLAI